MGPKEACTPDRKKLSQPKASRLCCEGCARAAGGQAVAALPSIVMIVPPLTLGCRQDVSRLIGRARGSNGSRRRRTAKKIDVILLVAFENRRHGNRRRFSCRQFYSARQRQTRSGSYPFSKQTA